MELKLIPNISKQNPAESQRTIKTLQLDCSSPDVILLYLPVCVKHVCLILDNCNICTVPHSKSLVDSWGEILAPLKSMGILPLT